MSDTEQIAALLEIQQLILRTGLSADQLSALSPIASSESSPSPDIVPLPSPGPLPSASVNSQHPAVVASRYVPPLAHHFTSSEIQQGRNRVNRKTSAHAIVEHPKGAIIEYPQTGEFEKQIVAHIFPVDPLSFCHPKLSFQYSLGDGHGGLESVKCYMLRDSNNQPVQCEVLKISCKGLKICAATRHDGRHQHHFTDRNTVTTSHVMLSASEQTPEREVFLKTLGFFSALQEHGCPYSEAGHGGVHGDDDSSGDMESHALSADQFVDGVDLVNELGASQLSRRSKAKRCHGQLKYGIDEYNQSFIRCSLRSHDRPQHLLLYSLQEYDTEYLRALLEDNWEIINKHEHNAKSKGYGPLMPCDYVASPSTQTQLCPHWHRLADNKLKRGTLRKWTHGCKAKYHIYVPHDLHACPQVLILCENPHSHPPPAPVKTPRPLKNLFDELLLLMKWKLADATPRRIFLDTAFVEGLQRALGWDRIMMGREATLIDLHPSFANLDRVRRRIMKLRKQQYPCGTGFEGAQLLVEEQTRLPLDQRYVRCAEVHKIGQKSYLKLIVCMTTRMSSHLLAAKRLSIDTSFKRAQGWQEFEIESWDINHQRSVVCARAFINSQTANAHLIFFRRIFEIAMGDTGIPVTFRHIHGSGIESVVADSHKGQALGLGMFCVEVSRNITRCCIYEPHYRISQLSPYDHLRRFYRLCVAHFQRNLHALKPIVPSGVYKAMRSLASSEPHPDIEATLSFIRNSHPKAEAWLKDKVDTSPFALPGLYQPASLIPLNIWKACPSTTNGNEQAHRNAYREGINLTLLAGIMKGMKYDQAAMVSIDTHSALSINTRDAEATHAFRAARTISRKVTMHQKRVSSMNLKDTSTDKQPSIPPPPTSIHVPPTSSQLSKTNSLAWALVPHARIVDYTPPPIIFNSITEEYLKDSNLPLSTYTSLAGALDDPQAQRQPTLSELATDSFYDWFPSLTSNPATWASTGQCYEHHRLHKL